MQNIFLTSPFKVVIYDAIKNTPSHTFCFLGDVPKNIISACENYQKSHDKTLRDWYGAEFKAKLALGHDGYQGADDEYDISDIEELLKDKPAAKRVEAKQAAPEFETGTSYVTNIAIFPEDKISELRDKIYLSTGIPPYRQHLFALDENIPVQSYRIIAEGVYPVDIRTISSEQTLIADIPIDKVLYDMRDSIHIDALDTFTLLSQINDYTMYVVDLAQFTQSKIHLADIVKDTYQFGLFYYGFLIKYFPLLTPECALDYLINEDELGNKYPDLVKPKSTLTSIYKIEREIASYNYSHAPRMQSYAESHTTLAITQITASISTPRTLINIRNLFDKLQTTRCLPAIHAYIEHNGKKYLLTKKHVLNASDIHFPIGNLMKNGVTIAISLRKSDQDSFHARRSASTMQDEQSRYMFLNITSSGKYFVRAIWNEEDRIGFEQTTQLMKKFTDNIIASINAMGKYVFIVGGPLPQINKQNLSYHNLSICIYWKKVMLESAFKLVKGLLEPYFRSRIIAQRNVQQFDRTEFLFRKGMHEFDASGLEKIVSSAGSVKMHHGVNLALNNQYAYLSNNIVKQKWDQNYDGRITRIYHRTSDVKFEVVSIREAEFKIFYLYIIGFIYSAHTNTTISQSLTAVPAHGEVKKLKKLREQDPELFNLKKHGSKKVYSILCQNPRPPLIYTQDEVNHMSSTEARKLVEYWNFTLNKPAYYSCPNKKYPHLNFMVGMHPKGYCLPCCNKKYQMGENSRRSQINDLCMEKHKYSEDADVDAASTHHVMVYGKEIDVGRLSKLPLGAIQGLLYNTTDPRSSYYLYGIQQHLPGVENIGIIFAVSESLGVPLPKLIKMVLETIKKSPGLFTTLLNGILPEYFHSLNDLLVTLQELFGMMKSFSKEYKKFTQWPELFVELFHMLGITIFTFIDETGNGQSLELYIPNTIRSEIIYQNNLAKIQQSNEDNEYIVVIKQINKVYPIFILNIDNYFRNRAIESRSYNRNDKIIELLHGIVLFDAQEESNITSRVIDLAFIKSLPKWKITREFINKQNLCYAVIVSHNSQDVYLPIDYSTYSADGVEIYFEPFIRSQYNLTHAALIQCIEDINNHIGVTPTYARIVIEKYFSAEGANGLIANNMMFYFNDSVDTERIQLKYDYEALNKLILARADGAADNRTMRRGEALYDNYQYQLFVLEFINHISTERNTVLRKAIIKQITETNLRKQMTQLRTSLKELLAEWPDDHTMLITQISETISTKRSKEDLIEQIAKTVYSFDRVTITRLQTLTHDELIAELTAISANLCVQRDLDTTNLQFPNIYLPCEYMNGVSYCDGKKLIITKPLDEFVKLLANDLTNKLKSNYLLSGAHIDTIVNWLQFEQHPSESITIYKINE